MRLNDELAADIVAVFIQHHRRTCDINRVGARAGLCPRSFQTAHGVGLSVHRDLKRTALRFRAASAAGDANKFLKGNGTWADPANTEYIFTDGTTGNFTVTAAGTPQVVSIGKPATAGTADQVTNELSITLGASGTAQTFDGSADVSVTVTPVAIGAAEEVHTHTSDEITIGNGYAKPATVTPIATTDTVQQAIGKLEAMFDWVVYNS